MLGSEPAGYHLGLKVQLSKRLQSWGLGFRVYGLGSLEREG